jgi:hypothetical protein
MHSTGSTKVRVYNKLLNIWVLEIQQSKLEKYRKDIQSFSMTVEAGVSLESRRTPQKPKLDVLDEVL